MAVQGQAGWMWTPDPHGGLPRPETFIPHRWQDPEELVGFVGGSCQAGVCLDQYTPLWGWGRGSGWLVNLPSWLPGF